MTPDSPFRYPVVPTNIRERKIMAIEHDVRALAETLRQIQSSLHETRQQQQSLLSRQELTVRTIQGLATSIERIEAALRRALPHRE
jgi:hypothetical protein